MKPAVAAEWLIYECTLTHNKMYLQVKSIWVKNSAFFDLFLYCQVCFDMLSIKTELEEGREEERDGAAMNEGRDGAAMDEGHDRLGKNGLKS